MSMREASDIDEVTFSFAQIKAIATANPDFLRQMQLISDIKELYALRRKHTEMIKTLQRRATIEYPQSIAHDEARLLAIEEDIASTYTKDAKLTIGGKTFETLGDEAASVFQEKSYKAKNGDVIGTYGGMKVLSEGGFGYALVGKGKYTIEAGASTRGTLTKIANAYEKLPELKAAMQERVDYYKAQLEDCNRNLQLPFSHEEELAEKERELAEINKRLNVNSDEGAADATMSPVSQGEKSPAPLPHCENTNENNR